MLLDGFFGLLRLPLDAYAKDHFRRDGEKQQTPGDEERGQGYGQRAQEPVADERAAGEDQGGDHARPPSNAATRRSRQAVRDGEKCRHQADGVDDDEERDQRGDEEFERHDRRQWYAVSRVQRRQNPRSNAFRGCLVFRPAYTYVSI